MRVRHPLLFGLLPLLILIVGFGAWVGPTWVAMYRYSQRSHRIWEKLCNLERRRPTTVSPRLWEESVGWAVTAHGNICYSEEHASYDAMCRFEKELDEKLEGDVDLGTIQWIGDRLAETGLHGQRYMTKWREQWKALQEWGNGERQPSGN